MHVRRGSCMYANARIFIFLFFFFQAEDGIRDGHVTGVQTCALPILASSVEAATSNTSPPGGPSEIQAPLPAGILPGCFAGTAGPGLMPLARFPFSSR